MHFKSENNFNLWYLNSELKNEINNKSFYIYFLDNEKFKITIFINLILIFLTILLFFYF